MQGLICQNAQGNGVTARWRDLPTEAAGWTRTSWPCSLVRPCGPGAHLIPQPGRVVLAGRDGGAVHLNPLQLNTAAAPSTVPRQHSRLHPLLPATAERDYPAPRWVNPPLCSSSVIYAGRRLVHLLTSTDLLPSRVKYLGRNLHLSSNVLARISVLCLFLSY